MSEKNDRLHAMRHSLAHILATAIKSKYPEAKFGVGPVVENGFYYDLDLGDIKLTDQDFEGISLEMKKIIEEDYEFIKSYKSIDDAIDWAKDNNQPYKLELLNDLKRQGTTLASEINPEELGIEADGESSINEVSFYTDGDFTDLCRGPHVESTGKVGSFKLLRVGGAYWRGNEKNNQMQRIYGVAFETNKELSVYLNMLEEAKKRDHRKLGGELDLFIFSDLVGSGLPLFTPRGTVMREELIKYSNELRLNIGYEKVYIPHITKTALYEVSGHMAKFGDELMLVQSQETSDKLALKPMNCPHHTRIYASRPRSYKDLPVRYLETTTVYRDEKTGELGGLNRVRALTQDDSHVFCSPDDIQAEINNLVKANKELYTNVGMSLKIRLSFRDDGDGYLGDVELWTSAQNKLREAVKDHSLEFYVEEGEAAFYGPKIDFMATDAIGREHQVCTIQLDFVQPERFDLEYTDNEGNKQRPVMIHCALLGSVERFMSVYIEHISGKFPVWLAPEQVRIITLNQSEEIVGFAENLLSDFKDSGIRATLDNDSESVGKKIRNAELYKVPYVIVIGGKEVESGIVTPRIRTDLVNENGQTSLSIEEFKTKVSKEHQDRLNKSTI